MFPLVRVTTAVLPADFTTALDVDVAEVEADGGYDVFVSSNNTGTAPNERYLRDTTTANDVTSPSLSRLEQASNRIVDRSPTVVRLHVSDNTPA